MKSDKAKGFRGDRRWSGKRQSPDREPDRMDQWDERERGSSNSSRRPERRTKSN
jgi:hypothetical protein